MGIFSGIKDLLGQINRIDGAVYTSGRDFADVYARNIALEEEIAVRTKELEQANQTILTLNSVWDMMNSSQPLSSLLDKIVSILHDDMSYVYTAILKLNQEENGSEYFSIMSSSEDKLVNSIFSIINETAQTYKIPYVTNSIIEKSLLEGQICSTPDMKGVLNMFFPALNDEQLKDFVSQMITKSAIFVPLKRDKTNYGCVVITSTREITSDTELNFLSLFANQIELAITVAGLFEEVKNQAITDPLTGIYNRRYFEENIVKEAERALRLKQPFSLISMDLDYLKRINDTYGHQFGDLAIKTISNILKKEARSIDIPARIGGEEFNLLLPGVDSNGAYIAAERIRKSIESQVLDTIGTITASIGVATFLEHSDRIDELTELADQAMYKAKLNGRNQVQLAVGHESVNWQKLAVEAFTDILNQKRIPVDEKIAKEIIGKLHHIKVEEQSSKDILYSIVDMISQTYNQAYKTGTTKSKLFLAVMLAQRLEMSKEDIDKLKLAILLYDIGNVMIPEEIYNKKGPLNDHEKEIMRQHPIIAAREILQPITDIQDIIPIIEAHHENWDGKGYPNQKAGVEIPIMSQIVLLVDAFYAMTQDRPYRNAYTLDEALKNIKEDSGKKWNEKLVDEFIYIVKNGMMR